MTEDQERRQTEKIRAAGYSPDGGPAFPQHDLSGYGMGPAEINNRGMTLRDYIAAQALGGMLANCDEAGLNGWGGLYADAAKEAYSFADAMLAAREAAQ